MALGKGKKKPPVFIGLGAVYNRNFEHSFSGTGIPWSFEGLDKYNLFGISTYNRL
jgi:hypothetical protein